MAVSGGTISQSAVGGQTANLRGTAATGGTGPYTYQWYRSLSSSFSPGPGTIIDGATGQDLDDSNLIPNTTYYYERVTTDTGDSNATASSNELTVVTTPQSLSPNSFQQQPLIGALSLQLNFNTVAVQIDASQATPLYAGMPVKLVDSSGPLPLVVGISAATDEVFGFLNFNPKSQAYVAGDAAEASLAGNCMYMVATAAIGRGKQVIPVIAPPGIKEVAGSGAANIVGFAYDKAEQAGDVIRVMIKTPSYEFDGS